MNVLIVASMVHTNAIFGSEEESVNTIAQGNNRFALELYGEIKEKEKGNIFYSPFSISSALAMTYAGSKGRTEKEMAAVLHFEPNSTEFHQAFGEYLACLSANAKDNIEFEIANRLWAEKTFKFRKEFIELVNASYGAGVENVDFVNDFENARIMINDWVALKTKERIKDLIPKGVLDANTRLVLVNAIYFKGDWQSAFDVKHTKVSTFYVEKGKDVEAQFMHQTGHFNYEVSSNCSMIRLPYKGDKQSMIVALPTSIDKLEATEDEIKSKDFKGLLKGSKSLVELTFPKFKMTMPLMLSKYLIELGMKDAFNVGADFSKMDSLNRLNISEVIHKAFIEVDEKGTEAAAATAVVMSVTTTASSPVRIPIVFKADHPFLYYIVDNETGAILFMGRMVQP